MGAPPCFPAILVKQYVFKYNMKPRAYLQVRHSLFRSVLYSVKRDGNILLQEDVNHKLTLFYKMINGFCPGYLCSLVSPTVGNASSYSLRNAANSVFHSNIQQCFNSFLSSAIREWHDLPLVFRDSTAVPAFKYQLNANLTQPPSFFT